MIPMFEDVYKLTDTIASETAFSLEESRALYYAACLVPPGSTIVEVGCEFGRSTSILAQVAKARGHHLTLIEPVVRWELIHMLNTIGCIYTLHAMRTEQVETYEFPENIGLLHIDGDHSTRAIEDDCVALLPLLTVDGIACFHDYGRESLPDVKPTVDRFIEQGLDRFERYTRGTLHIVRRAE